MQNRLRLKVPPKNTLIAANKEDPLRGYYHPLLGWLFQHRINVGLSLLTYPVESVLEVGCGSGILISTLIDVCQRYTGIDTELPVITPYLASFGEKAVFRQMDICHTDFPDNFFDTIIIFSVFEHIRDLSAALKEVRRILKPQGQCIAGFPLVNSLMNSYFRFIGFNEVDKCHINNSTRIIGEISDFLKIDKVKTIPACVSSSIALYTCLRATKYVK